MVTVDWVVSIQPFYIGDDKFYFIVSLGTEYMYGIL